MEKLRISIPAKTERTLLTLFSDVIKIAIDCDFHFIVLSPYPDWYIVSN